MGLASPRFEVPLAWANATPSPSAFAAGGLSPLLTQSGPLARLYYAAMAGLILTSPMARVATSELIQRLESALALFPELGDDPVTVGVTASRWLDGLAIPSERLIRLNPFRRRVTYFTIGHELTHLLQPPGMPLIPGGEVQCDIWTLARDELFLDEKPTYFRVNCDGRS
jgi:hypothetical protein